MNTSGVSSHRRVVSLLWLGYCAIPAAMQSQEANAVATGKVHSIRSGVMQEQRRLLVTLPESYDRTTVGYPVLFMLDGSSHILHATATTRFLSHARNRIPEMIVVAVPNTNRNRDLTPGPGAARFQRFFADELIPWVDSAYRTVPERIIMGHSLGGSFVTHTMLNRPELFDVYIAASAPLWRYDSLARDMRQGLSRAATAGATIYLTVGEREWSRLREGVISFADRLKAADSSKVPKWSFVDLPHEDHSSTPLRTLYSSLETHYVAYRFPFFEERADLDSLGGLLAIEAHFQRLTTQLGYPARPPESKIIAVGEILIGEGKHAELRALALAYRTDYPVVAEQLINQTGYDLLRRGETGRAIDVFTENTALFPNSPNTFDSLADAYCRAGNETAARDRVRQAVSVAERRAHPRVDRYRSRVAQPCPPEGR